METDSSDPEELTHALTSKAVRCESPVSDPEPIDAVGSRRRRVQCPRARGQRRMTDPSAVVSSIYRSGKLYDRLYPGSAEGRAFWVELAETCGDPILELMSGTGSIAIPLAQAGHDVTGLELAEPMLAEAERKGRAAGVDVTWVQGDARAFDLGRRFKLITLPANSICHLLTRQDLEGCLAAVARHLRPDGRFALSVFVPSLRLLMMSPDEEQ